tara:strand:+ start:1694 stop:1945 length:252 start_codon:yes stop_codon:yes gene_type:complete
MIESQGIVVINDRCYLDLESHIVAVQIDRVTFSIYADEFLDFFESLEQVKDYFIESDDYVIGTTMDKELKKVIVPKPDESECS